MLFSNAPLTATKNEYTVLASEAGGSEYGGHARSLRPTVMSTDFTIILVLVCVQIFVKMGNSGDLTKKQTTLKGGSAFFVSTPFFEIKLTDFRAKPVSKMECVSS